MDPNEVRGGAGPARAGIDEETGQLTADEDGGPRQAGCMSSDFYAVYQWQAGKQRQGLVVNLFCWSTTAGTSLRAGDANPAQLTMTGPKRGWSGSRTWYAAHEQLMTAWAGVCQPLPASPARAARATRLEEARAAWDEAITAIDEARTRQLAAPGLQ